MYCSILWNYELLWTVHPSLPDLTWGGTWSSIHTQRSASFGGELLRPSTSLYSRCCPSLAAPSPQTWLTRPNPGSGLGRSPTWAECGRVPLQTSGAEVAWHPRLQASTPRCWGPETCFLSIVPSLCVLWGAELLGSAIALALGRPTNYWVTEFGPAQCVRPKKSCLPMPSENAILDTF